MPFSYSKYQALLRSLTTDEQNPAATHGNGPAYVFAASGSGKTRCYAARFCHLVIDKNVPVERILGITFSRNAAEEMRKRVCPVIGMKDDELKTNICTFHSLGFNILKREGLITSNDVNGLIVQEWKQRSLIIEYLDNNKLTRLKNDVNEILHAVSRWKGRLIDPADVSTSAYANIVDSSVLGAYVGAYAHYENYLSENDKIDYQDMVTKAVVLLRQRPDILERYQSMWDHILVDEGQDTDYSQMQFITLLGQKHSNVWMCLDMRQSIFLWRGGAPNIIEDFIKTFPTATRYELTRNYRSLENICKVANHTASHMGLDVSDMVAMRGEGGDVNIHYVENDYDHGQNWVVADIKAKIEAGEDPKNIAILSRLNVNLAHFEDALSRNGVPYRLCGGSSVYERRELRAMVLLAHLAIEDDPESLHELMQKVRHSWFKYISNDYITKMFLEYSHNPVLGLKEFKFKDQYGRIKTGQMNMANIAAAKLTTLREKCGDSENLPQLFNRVLEHGDIENTLRDQLIEWGYDDDASVDSIVKERMSFLKDMIRVSERYDSIEAFNKYLGILAQNKPKKNSDVVTLSSIHKAKGLEWKHVYVVDVTDNHLPHENGDIMEERRIYYVAVTRAKDRVVLITNQNNTSRFIKEYFGDRNGNNNKS